jgi:hypothetical protein
LRGGLCKQKKRLLYYVPNGLVEKMLVVGKEEAPAAGGAKEKGAPAAGPAQPLALAGAGEAGK